MKFISKISKFSQLPDDITYIIYNLHYIHFNYHKEKLKYLHKELISNLSCIVCNQKKNYFHDDDFCSSSCEWEATKYDYYSETEEEEQMYYKKLYDEYKED